MIFLIELKTSSKLILCKTILLYWWKVLSQPTASKQTKTKKVYQAEKQRKHSKACKDDKPTQS